MPAPRAARSKEAASGRGCLPRSPGGEARSASTSMNPGPGNVPLLVEPPPGAGLLQPPAAVHDRDRGIAKALAQPVDVDQGHALADYAPCDARDGPRRAGPAAPARRPA